MARKVMAAFLFLLVLAGANIVLMQSLLREAHAMAAAVNVAGKLRMLSQKIAVDAMSLSLGQGSGVAEIERSMNAFDAVLHALTNGGTVFGLDIQQLRQPHVPHLNMLEQSWGSYRQAVEKALAVLARPVAGMADKTAMHQKLGGDAGLLLRHIEALVGSVVDEHQAEQQQFMTTLYTLLWVDALILLLAFAARQTFSGWKSLKGC